jgi:photosystem II stability/assembly factor-like uncharacterized protein
MVLGGLLAASLAGVVPVTAAAQEPEYQLTAAALPTVRLSPASLSAPAGSWPALELAIDPPQPAETIVSFTSSDPARVAVLGTVPMPAGRGSVTFLAAAVSAGGPVTIQANLPAAIGGGSATADITVTAMTAGAWANRTAEPATVTTLAIDPMAPATLYVGTASGGVYKSSDAAASWRPINAGLQGGAVQALAVDPRTPSTIYAGTDGARVFRSVDGGASWVERSPRAGAPCELDCRSVHTLAIDPTNPSRIWAAGDQVGGGLYFTGNDGSAWSQQLVGKIHGVAVAPSNPNRVLAGRGEGEFGILRSTDGGATWQQVAGYGGYIFAFHPTNANVVYLGIYNITVTGAPTPSVYKSTDGGATWSALANGPKGWTVGAIVIDPKQPSTVFVTHTPGIFKTVDAGQTWTLLAGSPFAGALVVDPVNTQTLYAAGSATVYTSTDGGVTWSGSSTGLQSTETLAVAVDPERPGILYAGEGGAVMTSGNAGLTWSRAGGQTAATPAVNALAVDPANPDRVVALRPGRGAENGIFVSDDAGTLWRNVAPQELRDARALLMLGARPDTAFIGLGGAGVCKSTDAGETWRSAMTPVGGDVADVATDSSTAGTLYAVTAEGPFKTTDGGASWSSLPSGLDGVTGFNTIAVAPSDSRVLYLGHSNGVERSSNGGAAWAHASTGLPRYPSIKVIAIDPTTPTTVYAGVYFNGVWKSTDGGGHWSSASAGLTNLWINGLAVDPKTPATLYTATNNGGLSKSTDAGQSWAPAGSGLPLNMNSVAIDPVTPATIYAAATYGGGPYKSTNGGATWSTIRNGLNSWESVSSLIIDPKQPAHLLGFSGNLYTSSNGGASWTRVDVTFPAGAGITTLAIDGGASDTLYAGTKVGVWKGSATASSWGPCFPRLAFATVRSFVSDPAKPDTIYAGTLDQGVWKSPDLGANWSPANGGLGNLDVPALAATTAGSTTLLAGTFGGGVFRSTNGGASWMLSSSGMTNPYVMAFAVHPRKPLVVFAGTNGGGVFRSTDGGATWAPFAAGLFSNWINALAIDANATFLHAATGNGVFDVRLDDATPALLALTPPASEVAVGAARTLTISIAPAQSGATAVNVASSSAGVASAPAAVTVAAGATTATFQVTGQAVGQAEITASLPASIGGAATAADIATRPTAGSLADAPAIAPLLLHLSGLNSAQWRGDLKLANPTAAAVTGTLTFTPRGSSRSASNPRRSLTIAANAVTVLADAWSLAHATGTGADRVLLEMDVNADTGVPFPNPVVETVMKSVLARGGEYGLCQTTPRVRELYSAGAVLAAILGGSGERDSVYVVTGAAGAKLKWEYRDPAGSGIVTVVKTYAKETTVQHVGVKEIIGFDPAANASLTATVQAGDVWLAITHTNNTTNAPRWFDFQLVPAGAPPGVDEIVPIVLHLGGLNGSQWRSDLKLYNPTAKTASGSLTFTPRGKAAGAADPRRTFSLAANAVAAFPDAWTLAHTGGTGADRVVVRMDVDAATGKAFPSPVVEAVMRSLLPTGGDYGLCPRIVRSTELLGAGARLLAILGASGERDSVYVTTGDGGATVQYTYRAGDGSGVTVATKSYAKGTTVQLVDPVKEIFGFAAPPHGSLDARVTAGAAWLAITHTNNATNAPRWLDFDPVP